ncbi:type II toxin-antitoxin system RatA family toxin, partial [Francisella tularensis]|uniref:type II toxin-antitoxin system RatA family toxin n=1 Tax=Francisella tularensis TaxID=263 RepID=UPI001F22FE5C
LETFVFYGLVRNCCFVMKQELLEKPIFGKANTMVKNEHIHLNLMNGPFKSLTGDWKFEPIDEDSCKVSLDMEFTFENKFVERALGPVFRGLADKMLGAFCKRAEEVYK